MLLRPALRCKALRCNALHCKALRVATTKLKPLTMTSAIPRRNFFAILGEYQRGVRFFLGKNAGQVLQPGLRLNLPVLHDLTAVDMRDRVDELAQQVVITKDNVSITVDASIQYRIVDAHKSVLKVRYVKDAVLERAKMTLREGLTSMDVDEILAKRDVISKAAVLALKGLKEEWGVEVTAVQLRDIVFDQSMKQAMGTQAEAERQARAKIINAKADVETAQQYAEASKIYRENPISLRLREFQLWNSVSKNPGASIYVVPSELLNAVKAK
jgi:regulator of protease activity HflC (stomatin/prohibitin superfamily)